jgi:hypothetical protein
MRCSWNSDYTPYGKGRSRCPTPDSLLDLFTGNALAAGERAGQAICGFTSSLAERVAHEATSSVAEAFLKLLDVLLVGRGDLGDLVWQDVSACYIWTGEVTYL